MSEQSFVQQLVQESLPVWEQCLHSEFLERLADGTLDEACFKGYIVEDSLYLREYAKVFAWGMTKAADMQTIRTYYSLLSFVNENEDAERLRCLRQFGLTDEGIQSLPLRPENRAYVDYMIDTARNSRVHDGLPALHAELQLDLPEAAERASRCAGCPLWCAGGRLCRQGLRGSLPRLGCICRKDL